MADTVHTPDTVRAQMQADIASANAVTGGSDTTVHDAVTALIAGYGQGGGSGDNETLKAILEGTITEFVDENVTKICSHALRDRKYLKKVSLPNCIALESYAFAACPALVDIYLPKCKDISNYSFQGIGAEYISLPSVTSRVGTMFGNSKNLRVVDFVAPKNFTTNAFNGCSALDTLILRNTASIIPLANVNAFAGTPFAVGGTGGTAYVPAALIESYKTDTNWVTLYDAGTCNFVAIEGSEYE